jgi:hypothetical protein
VEENNAALGGVLQRRGEASEVKAASGRVIVRVLGNGEGDIVEDLLVVRPGWVREVDRLVLRTRVELGEEAGAGVESAGAGDGLD